MNKYCKVLLALNKYKGALCNSVQDAEYTFEVEWSQEISPFNDGSYILMTYHKGEQCDLMFNGWSFAGVNSGGYHYPGSYSSVSIAIECCDPNGICFKVNNSMRDNSNFLTEGAALYMNKIMFVCLFKDKKEYEYVCDIYRNISLCTSDIEVLKETLVQLQRFNDIIKRNEVNKNVPSHFIINARNEYRKIVSYLRDNVDMEKIFEVLFD